MTPSACSAVFARAINWVPAPDGLKSTAESCALRLELRRSSSSVGHGAVTQRIPLSFASVNAPSVQLVVLGTQISVTASVLPLSSALGTTSPRTSSLDVLRLLWYV